MTGPLSVALTVGGEPALYAGPVRNGHLKITNTSGSEISFTGEDGEPSFGAHHIGVFLPAGTLSPASLGELRAVEGWVSAVGQRVDGDNRWDAIFLSTPKRVVVPDGGDLSILLHGLSAAVGGRARHTRVIVEVNLDHEDLNLGTRATVVHVMPWEHNPAHLHLHAGLVGDPSVVNRAEVANQIKLRLTGDAILGTVGLIGGQTEIQLSWDVGSPKDRWWALCTPAEANAATVEVKWSEGAAGAATGDDTEIQSDVWVSTTAATWSMVVPRTVELGEGDSIGFVIDNLYTAHPSGPANLYLDVVGAEGGLSGRFVVPVHKKASRWDKTGSLTLYGGAGDQLITVFGRHGHPAARLDRSSGDDGHALRLFADDGEETVTLDAAGRSSIKNGLDVKGWINAPWINATGRLMIDNGQLMYLVEVDVDAPPPISIGRSADKWVGMILGPRQVHLSGTGAWPVIEVQDGRRGMAMLRNTTMVNLEMVVGDDGNWELDYDRDHLLFRREGITTDLTNVKLGPATVTVIFMHRWLFSD